MARKLNFNGKMLAFRMSEPMHDAIIQYSKEYDIEKSDVIRQCIAKCLGVKEDSKIIKFEI